MHYLSICAIHKFESWHLQEWIAYHRYIGVDHFYLVDNNDSPFETELLLESLIDQGIVTTIHMPGQHKQIGAYQHLLSVADTQWLAFIDIDEFIFPQDKILLSELLAEYEPFGGLVANWFCFGSSGLADRPHSVIEQLQHRAVDSFPANSHVKSIIQPHRAAGMCHPHYPVFADGWFNVNEDGERVDGPFQQPRQRRLRINHYPLRSLQNFRDKALRARSDAAGNPYNEEYWRAFDRNEVHDDTLWIKYGRKVDCMEPARVEVMPSPVACVQTFIPGSTMDNSKASFRPIYWFRVPHSVMTELRTRRFHDGHWRSGRDTDMLLERVFSGDLRDGGRERQIDGLRLWATFVERESIPVHGYPALWHPDADEAIVRDVFKPDRLVVVEAETTAEALHQLRLTKWELGVFYHIACMGNWRAIVQNQLDLCARVGLSGIHIVVLGDDASRIDVERAFQERGIDFVVEYWSPDFQMYEVPSITFLQQWCRAHKESYALYFHTKGVSSPDDMHKARWRAIMEREVIGKWQDNARLLQQGVDVVGVNWRETPPISHMPGNFYMARAEYIADNLRAFGDYYRNPPFWDSWPSNSYRLQCEFWLGSYRRTPRVHSLVSWNERIDHPDYFKHHPV